MPTAAELRRLQAETRKAIEELEAQLKVLREQEVTLGDLAAKMETAGLHIGGKRSRISSSMQLATEGKSKNVRISASLTQRESNAKRLLLEAGLTDKDISDELTEAGLKASRPSVNAWFNGRRAIPASREKYLREKYHVPKAAWPRVGK